MGEEATVKNGVCLLCGSGVLNNREHLRDDLPPCYGDRVELPNEPLPPGYDDPEALLRHIADMVNCSGCYPDTPRSFIRNPYSICSKHRDPVLLANGYVHGWTHQGGLPQNYKKDDG